MYTSHLCQLSANLQIGSYAERQRANVDYFRYSKVFMMAPGGAMPYAATVTIALMIIMPPAVTGNSGKRIRFRSKQ